jgi:hypothetical protein
MPGNPWEHLDESSDGWLDRMAVPGGWIYRQVYFTAPSGDVTATALVFVPAPVTEELPHAHRVTPGG